MNNRQIHSKSEEPKIQIFCRCHESFCSSSIFEWSGHWQQFSPTFQKRNYSKSDFQNVWILNVQWGSEIGHLKSGLIEGSISNGRALVLATALVPTI